MPRAEAPRYPVDVGPDGGQLVLDPRPAGRRRRGRPPGRARRCRLVAAGFHEAIGRAAADAAVDAWPAGTGCATVALSGGVFQNVRLSEVVEERSRAAGLEVLVHREVPPNDGGISIGQAAHRRPMSRLTPDVRDRLENPLIEPAAARDEDPGGAVARPGGGLPCP